MKIFSISVIFPLCFYSLLAQTPMLSNQGALISVKNGAFIAIHGNVLNENGGRFHNSDTIHLFGNWENNAGNDGFTSRGSGIVTLSGEDQIIKGDNPTRFYDLRLENSGVKFLSGTNAIVEGFLRLNDREFNTDSNVVQVINTSLNAVQSGLGGNFGYVSSTNNGGLQRNTSFSGTYAFFLGSSQGSSRFRPIHLKMTSASPSSFLVRFANTDASNEGFNLNSKSFDICTINSGFYHKISRVSGNSDAVVNIFTDTLSDGNYRNMSHWDGSKWYNVSPLRLNTAQYGLQQLTTDSVIVLFSPNPFALVNTAPKFEIAANENPICSNELFISDVNGVYTNYDFIVDSQSAQNGTELSYQTYLSPGNHQLWVTASNGVCGINSDTINISVLSAPQPRACEDSIIVESSRALLYASGADFYEWTPTTGLSCSVCPVTAAFPTETTSYILRGENIDGCINYDTVVITIKSNLKAEIDIPNVITPNNDGYNDTWKIPNLQFFTTRRVTIINRWGDIVYQSEYYNDDWDGTYGNSILPAGTYYYILDLGAAYGVYKGDVTIIRE